MKILLVRVSSLGDVLHNLPVVDDLRAAFPEAQIDWVVEEAFVPLVRLHPGVREVIPFALRRWRRALGHAATWRALHAFVRRLRAERYDAVLETQGLIKTGLILGLARCQPGGKFGLANGTEGSGYEPLSRLFHDRSITVDRHTHAVLRGRRVAAALTRIPPSDLPHFGLNTPPAPEPPLWPATPFCVFFHGTAGAAKKWPIPHWIALGQALAQADLPLLLPWGNDSEHADAQAIAAAVPHARVLPRLPLAHALRLAHDAALVVGVDSGLTHVAAAYLRPTVEIYTASPRWKTEGNWSTRILNLGDASCPPRVEDVLLAARQLLAAWPPGCA